jgi:hypothetical protein
MVENCILVLHGHGRTLLQSFDLPMRKALLVMKREHEALHAGVCDGMARLRKKCRPDQDVTAGDSLKTRMAS